MQRWKTHRENRWTARPVVETMIIGAFEGSAWLWGEGGSFSFCCLPALCTLKIQEICKISTIVDWFSTNSCNSGKIPWKFQWKIWYSNRFRAKFCKIWKNHQFLQNFAKIQKKIEFEAVQRIENLVDLKKRWKMSIWLQNLASIQPRTSPPKLWPACLPPPLLD